MEKRKARRKQLPYAERVRLERKQARERKQQEKEALKSQKMNRKEIDKINTEIRTRDYKRAFARQYYYTSRGKAVPTQPTDEPMQTRTIDLTALKRVSIDRHTDVFTKWHIDEALTIMKFRNRKSQTFE